MSSDERTAPADVNWRPAGIGMSPRFRCGKCNQPRETTGRKLQRVLGLKTWVCRHCAGVGK